MQLISKSFTENPVQLREFIQNVEATYKVVELRLRPVIYICVCKMHTTHRQEFEEICDAVYTREY